MCAPGIPLPMWLDDQTDEQRRAALRVLAIARKHRGLVIEAVSVGVFIKRDRTIVELRPKQKWLQLSFVTTQRIASARIAKTWELARSWCYVLKLRDERDVDAQLTRWLQKALAE